MAVATWSSNAGLMKAVALPLILALLAMAPAGASSAEDGPSVANSGGQFPESPLGRKLLAINLCGTGTAPFYNCSSILPFAKNATCCTDLFGTKSCFDVGGFLADKCGSCTTKCPFGTVCCSGVCVNLLTDKNNCGICGRTCRRRCLLGLCNY